MRPGYFAILNRAAGGGRCGRLADGALENLRRGGIEVELAESRRPGHGSELTRTAYERGFRRFIAFGGDGTSHEIVNGLFPRAGQVPMAQPGEPVTLAFQPLGTGNSFLRDFTTRGADQVDHATEALLSGRWRPCDVLRLTYKRGSDQNGAVYYINLLSIGYSADVAARTNRRLKGWGPAGYLMSILMGLFQLRRPSLPLRTSEQEEFDHREHLFLAFCNSKYTGGRMLLAPQAETDNGLVEYVRCGPIGRMRLLCNLHKLYNGSFMELAAVSRTAVSRVEFDLKGPVDVVVDGEVLHLHCLQIDVLPAALRVMV